MQRFLRDARIQARLDHPAVVPVHELNTDAVGRPYFTMKKLTGRTLAQRMNDGATQNRLLRAFVEVCQAVAAEADRLPRYEITVEPASLRHFTARFAPLDAPA